MTLKSQDKPDDQIISEIMWTYSASGAAEASKDMQALDIVLAGRTVNMTDRSGCHLDKVELN